MHGDENVRFAAKPVQFDRGVPGGGKIDGFMRGAGASRKFADPLPELIEIRRRNRPRSIDQLQADVDLRVAHVLAKLFPVPFNQGFHADAPGHALIKGLRPEIGQRNSRFRPDGDDEVNRRPDSLGCRHGLRDLC